MKKIPTLFKREFENHKVSKIYPEVVEGMEWVLAGEGIASVKFDGACCAIIDGEFYKRYDAKQGKPIPEGAIKCQDDADPITGHLPCWLKCDRNNPADKWFWKAYDYEIGAYDDGTYEAIGKHFNGNPYNLDYDVLVRHGFETIIGLERSFEGIRNYLRYSDDIEGIVFWKDNEPKCKIKRSDFGFEWPLKN
ncbi:hypothetical protein J6S88_07750 [bacterium]|nr:hypothetical protein [bacterium]